MTHYDFTDKRICPTLAEAEEMKDIAPHATHPSDFTPQSAIFRFVSFKVAEWLLLSVAGFRVLNVRGILFSHLFSRRVVGNNGTASLTGKLDPYSILGVFGVDLHSKSCLLWARICFKSNGYLKIVMSNKIAILFMQSSLAAYK